MQTQNYLGLYVGKGRATGVCVHFKGHSRTVQGSFQVAVDPTQQEPFKALAKAIAEACEAKKLRFDETVVALDCALFMQHQVHSEFANPKQIAATIRYDTEEILATDVSAMAVSFQIVSTDETGASLNVYTAQQPVLQEIILALQGEDMDPQVAEPDVSSLARFVRRQQGAAKSETGPSLVGILSRQHGYFLRSAPGHQVVPIRAFLVDLHQERTELFAREAFTTMASAGKEPFARVLAYDSTGPVQGAALAERLGLEVTEAECFKTDLTGPQEPQPAPEDLDAVTYGIAFGAGLVHDDKVHTADFRNDFMPFQGRRLRLQNAIRWTSISVAVLIMAIGLHLQVGLMRVNKDLGQVRDRVSKDYSTVMKSKLPRGRNPVDELKREVRRIKDIKSGELELQNNVLARFGLLLKAFASPGDSGRGKIDLKVDSVNLTTTDITVVGSTASRSETEGFFKKLTDSGFEKGRTSEASQAGRSTFTVHVEPKKTAGAGGKPPPKDKEVQ
jgi:hypothetical protein